MDPEPPIIQPLPPRTTFHRNAASDPGNFNTYGNSNNILFRGPMTSSPEAIEEPNPITAGLGLATGGGRYRRSTLNVSSPGPRSGGSPGKETSGGPVRSNTAFSGWAADNAGLSHIDVPRKFGEVGEYWKYYDELSERSDKEMIRILSDNLDILLIFAGLFSSVNTAFIILSLTSLTADPQAKVVHLLTILAQGRAGPDLTLADLTPPAFHISNQAIRYNSFLSSSLACSLLAAFGAVLAKQWTLHFQRGHAGTLESQGRTRQRKLNGVERWQFVYAVETLPILLQLALVLFFIGLLDYLTSYDWVVAWVVMSLFIVAVVIYSLSLFFATVDPLCPYQTPISIFTRTAIFRAKSWAEWYLRGARRMLGRYRRRKAGIRMERRTPTLGIDHILPPVAIALGQAAGSVMHRARMEQVVAARERKMELEQLEKERIRSKGGSGVPSKKVDRTIEEENLIDNQTACWVIETSEHREALLATARNIPALRKVDGTRLSTNGLAFDRLLSLFKESLSLWRASNSNGTLASTSALEAAVIFGRAVGHAVVGSRGEGHAEALVNALQWPRWRKATLMGSYDANELVLLKFCVTAEISRDFCINHSKENLPRPSSALIIYLAAYTAPSVDKKDFQVDARKMDRITITHWLVSLCLSTPEIYTPHVVGFCAWVLGELPTMICETKAHFDADLRERWWTAYTQEDSLFPNIVQAFKVYHHYHRLSKAVRLLSHAISPDFAPLVSRREWVEVYWSLARATRFMIETGSRHQEVLNDWTMELDEVLRQTLATVKNQIDEAGNDEYIIYSLRYLEKELGEVLISLRKEGVEAMLPRMIDVSDGMDGEQAVLSLDEDESLSLFRANPELPSIITKGLLKPQEGTRYAALAIIHDHIFPWFDNGDEFELHKQFKTAGLAFRLGECLDGDMENFGLLCGILIQLIKVPSWRDEIVKRTDLFTRFHPRAMMIFKEEPSFRRIQLYLDVWQACREHKECRSFVEGFEEDAAILALIAAIRRVNYSGHSGTSSPQPYIPPSLLEFVGMVRTTRTSGDRQVGIEMDRIFEELERLVKASWWTLVETQQAPAAAR